MTHAEYLNLPKPKRDEFVCQLLEAIRKNQSLFSYADMIVSTAKDCGLFEGIKFGSEVEEPAY